MMLTRKIRVVFFFMSIIPALVLTEVITLIKDNNITCAVTKLTVNSAIYVNPPITSPFIKETTEMNNWIQDDWMKTDSSSSSYIPVTDKRWEDFHMSTQDDGYSLGENPFSFSIYTTGPIKFTIYSYDFSSKGVFEFKLKEDYITITKPSCQWFHYSIKTYNDTVNILEGNEVIETFKLNFSSPYWVYVDSSCSNTTFWKVHNYNFRSSKTITQSNTENSYLNISFTDNLCLSMYVSVDKNSFLQVTLDSNNKAKISTILGFNQEHSLKEWRKIEINADSPGTGKLSFFRGHTQNQKHGYWAVDDVKFCNQGLEIYKTHTSTPFTEDHTCEVLNTSKQATPDMNDFTKPGLLGSINCSTALGTSYTYCESHKICLADSTCFCSWGYQGSFCNQICDIGTWGLFCTNQCPFNCKKCHLSTGKCLEKREENIRLSETEFPKNIILQYGQIYIEMPNYEDINGELTYNFKYYCISEWCQNKIVQEENYTISSPFHYKQTIIRTFDDMVPFTDYKPIVTIVRKNETIEKSYSAITAQPELDDVELSVYSSNSTHLWIRFLPLQSSFENTLYSIWYDDSTIPLNSLEIQPCNLWNEFLCATISNLKSNTSYKIIVQEQNLQDGKIRISSTTVGFTSEKAPEAPTNFELKEFSENEIVLSWTEPAVTNGPLQYFDLEVNGKRYKIPSREETIYKQKISIPNEGNYSCGVRAVNKYQGEKTFLNIKFSPQNLTWHLPQPFVEICSETCHLMIPKPKEYTYSDYYILIIRNKDVMSPESQAKDILNLLDMKIDQDENLWTVNKFKEDSNFMYFNVGSDLGQAVPLEQHDLYSTYLVLTVNNNRALYSSKYSEILNENTILFAKSWSMMCTILTTILPFGMLLLLLLLLGSQREKISLQFRKKFYPNKSDKINAEQFRDVTYGILEVDVKNDVTKTKRIILEVKNIIYKARNVVHTNKKNKSPVVGVHNTA